jgi:hypothetical protein
MSAEADSGVADDGSTAIAVDVPVVLYPGTDHEKHGVVVEDFADLAGQVVEIAGTRIVGAARRWAVSTDDGGLEFVDSDDLVADQQK